MACSSVALLPRMRITLSSTSIRSTADWMYAFRNGISPEVMLSLMARPNCSIASGSKDAGWELGDLSLSKASIERSRSSFMDARRRASRRWPRSSPTPAKRRSASSPSNRPLTARIC